MSEGETERSKWRREQECVSECMGEPLRRKTFPALISCSPRCGCSEYVVTVTIGRILVVCLFKMVLNHVIYWNAVRYRVLNKAAEVKLKFLKMCILNTVTSFSLVSCPERHEIRTHILSES